MAATLRSLLTTSDADRAIEASRNDPVVIYKHSPICDLSADAFIEISEFARAATGGLQLHIVDVLGSRPVSKHLETVTGVRHESPQVLVLTGGKVAWHASHRKVRAADIREQVDALTPRPAA